MSVCTRLRERAAVPRGPAEQAAFVAQIYSDWAGTDRVRCRRLAAVVLRLNGWDYARIALALRTSRSRAEQLVRRGLESLREAHIPPTERDQREAG
jgi:hypothetical protein